MTRILLGLLVLALLYGIWRFFLAPEPGVETPVGQAVTGLLQRNDKGAAIRQERVHEKDKKPFPLLRENPNLAPLVSPSAINLLVVGRDVEANLYDTLLIVSMNPEDGAVRLVNIPRDLFVDYSDEAVARISKKIKGINQSAALRKINAAHKLGKLIGYREDNSRFGSPDYDFTADLLEEMLGLSIDDFVFIHHESFRQIVDEFDGVEMDVARGMRYNDPIQKLKINLAPGLQVLNGLDAEGFVRFRKGYDENGKYYEIGDLGRKENQNLFVQAFMKQHLTIGNLNRIVGLANRYTEFVETSVVGQTKVTQYTQIAKSLIAESFQTASVTLETDYQTVLGASHLVLGKGIANPPKGSSSGTKSSGSTDPKPEPEQEAVPEAGSETQPEATDETDPALATPPVETVPGGEGDVANDPGASGEVPAPDGSTTPDPSQTPVEGEVPDGTAVPPQDAEPEETAPPEGTPAPEVTPSPEGIAAPEAAIPEDTPQAETLAG